MHARSRSAGLPADRCHTSTVTRRYSSRPLTFTAHSPEDSQRDRECCSARHQGTALKRLFQYRSAALRALPPGPSATLCNYGQRGISLSEESSQTTHGVSAVLAQAPGDRSVRGMTVRFQLMAHVAHSRTGRTSPARISLVAFTDIVVQEIRWRSRPARPYRGLDELNRDGNR